VIWKNTPWTARSARWKGRCNLFGFFKKKDDPPIKFEDTGAAFRYACENAPEILIEAVIPAIVEEQGRIGSEGERYFRVCLATTGGGISIWAPTLPEAPALPEPGELVGVRIVMLLDNAPPDERIVGYVESLLQPVFVPGRGWSINRKITPPHMKPTIRF
jgi:hypothetical protein